MCLCVSPPGQTKSSEEVEKKKFVRSEKFGKGLKSQKKWHFLEVRKNRKPRLAAIVTLMSAIKLPR